MAEQFGAAQLQTLRLPTDYVSVLRVMRDRHDELEGTVMRWGLIPEWARGEQKGDTRPG